MSAPARRVFPGFPRGRVAVTPLPNAVFAQILPDVESLAELKVFLHVYWRVANAKGFPRYVTRSQLVNDGLLARGLRVANAGHPVPGVGCPAPEAPDVDVRPLAGGTPHLAPDLPPVLDGALRACVERGTLLHLGVKLATGPEDLYFVHTAASRAAIEQVRRGELDVGQLAVPDPPAMAPAAAGNIFERYEQNIGLLTPLIVEAIREAEKLYPAAWIEEAIGEAVKYNRRSWKYVERILERWAVEGKQDEASRRRVAATASPGPGRRGGGKR